MSVPPLDRDSTFEIYQVINLPIPYPRANQKMGAVARYRLETEYIALNLARNKFYDVTKRTKPINVKLMP